jgi:hypothetical protein
VPLDAHRPAGQPCRRWTWIRLVEIVRKPRSKPKARRCWIDIYPEYTGNGALFFNIDTDPAWKDPARLSRVQGLGGDRICRCRGHRLLFIPCWSGR